MKLYLIRLATTLLFFTAYAQAADTEPRHALIIGNSNYQSLQSLNNPEPDAKLLAETLSSLNFSVTLVLNADDEKMHEALDDFSDQILRMDRGTALFFYAGHGVQNRGKNRLLPVNYGNDKTDQAVTPPSVEGAIEALSINPLVRMFYIFDACRNVESLSMSTIESSINFNLPSNSLLAFSASSGQVAEDGTGRHSTYAASLAKNLKIKGLEAPLVFQYTRTDVLRKTKSRQRPTDTSTLAGSFQFSPGNPGNFAPSYRPIEDDKSAWAVAKSENSKLSYNTYIQDFPRGLYRNEAEERIDEINRMERDNVQKSTLLGIKITLVNNVDTQERLFVISQVDSDSPLYGLVLAEDVVKQVDYRAFHPDRISNPNSYIEDIFKKNQRLDLTIERNGTPYMISHH